MKVLGGAVCIGLALANLYFVIDTKETLVDVFNFFVFGITISLGIALIISSIREER